MEMEPLREVMQYYHKKEYVTVSVAHTDQIMTLIIFLDVLSFSVL